MFDPLPVLEKETGSYSSLFITVGLTHTAAMTLLDELALLFLSATTLVCLDTDGLVLVTTGALDCKDFIAGAAVPVMLVLGLGSGFFGVGVGLGLGFCKTELFFSPR